MPVIDILNLFISAANNALAEKNALSKNLVESFG
jgi:hypothetical protein